MPKRKMRRKVVKIFDGRLDNYHSCIRLFLGFEIFFFMKYLFVHIYKLSVHSIALFRDRSKSAMRSPTSSNPIESLKRFLGLDPYAPSTEARCSIRLSVPPKDVARLNICTFFTTYETINLKETTKNKFKLYLKGCVLK